MNFACVLTSLLSISAAAYLCGKNDIIGSYPVYYGAVFMALLVASSVISVFITMFFYHRSKEFKDVWFKILLAVSFSIFIFNLLPYGA